MVSRGSEWIRCWIGHLATATGSVEIVATLTLARMRSQLQLQLQHQREDDGQGQVANDGLKCPSSRAFGPQTRQHYRKGMD